MHRLRSRCYNEGIPRSPLLLVLFGCAGARPLAAPPSPAPPVSAHASSRPAPDTVQTSRGPLLIQPITHASLLFSFDGKVIEVDPWSRGDYAGLAPADLVLLTDTHPDHLDSAQLARVSKPGTLLVAPPVVVDVLGDTRKVDVVLPNGERQDVAGIGIEAVPMYNLVRGPQSGKLFHEKGRGNGYVLTFGDTRVYLSGDTECTDEMRALTDIDVAFVCMNPPYTMPPEEAAACVAAFRPKVVYPYHFRGADPEVFRAALAKTTPEVEVRIRDWYPE